MNVIKRDGSIVEFELDRIRNAVLAALRACQVDSPPAWFDDCIDDIQLEINSTFIEKSPSVERIQDIVERHLVQQDAYEVSKAYILYRERHREMRDQAQQKRERAAIAGKLSITKRDGRVESFDIDKVQRSLEWAAEGCSEEISWEPIHHEIFRNIFDGISSSDLERALILSVRSFIERDPIFDFIAARLVRRQLYREVFAESITAATASQHYRQSFIANIKLGLEQGMLTPKVASFDLVRLSNTLHIERDDLLTFLGTRTLYERYLIRHRGHCLETPQAFWMRVAMGLALREQQPNERAIEFYELFSTLRFVPSTPTLFHSALTRPQLSSCYISTAQDDLANIFKVIADNAQLSKWSGGIGNDWTPIRATGAIIKSTDVHSQGIIPFLKIANDTTVAINRSGKRRGATCAYLETWHLDIEDFLDLRRNTGDDRRRTHDMDTANWVPDLFMQRTREGKSWTLFSPDETPDLHELYGRAFEERYSYYEQQAQQGKIRKFKVVEAKNLWRKMLTRLFETGHPWITFKDPCNIRSPQDHCGIIHNSNLCTEVTLNNSNDETAVCNLGSVNLSRHTNSPDNPDAIDDALLVQTVVTAIRALDNVIDINFYPTPEAKNANMRHRPIGLGLMGLQDALFIRRIPFESDEALEFTDSIMELISYHAIYSSSRLAKERGAYASYQGSKWDRGIFPLDTVDMLEQERGLPIAVPRTQRLDWSPVRRHVAQHGMRNSNTMAIAPTATISNISGCFPCIEPIYKNIYVKANMNGEFTIVNQYLVADLKRLSLWNEEMLEQLKYYDGNISLIAGIPEEMKRLYKEVFEIDPRHQIAMTARRSKWIDQSQSHNIFMKGVSGTELSRIYMTAWEMGLKTTYYLRSLGASQIEKSTISAEKYGFTQKRTYQLMEMNGSSPSDEVSHDEAPEPARLNKVSCAIDDVECEVCQ